MLLVNAFEVIFFALVKDLANDKCEFIHYHVCSFLAYVDRLAGQYVIGSHKPLVDILWLLDGFL